MNLRGINKLYVVLLAAILATAGIVVAISSQISRPVDSQLPTTWDGILAQAREEGQISIFVDGALEIDEFLESRVIPEFEEEFGISVEMETGHWSGLTRRLLTERLGGRDRGLFDIVLLGDEPMGRSLDSNLLFAEASSRLERSSQIERIFREGVSGIRNDGSALTLWIDQNVLVANTLFIEEDDLPRNLAEIVGSMAEEEEEAEGEPGGEEELEIDPERLFFPNPLESEAGIAAVMLVVVVGGGQELYYFGPYDKSLEEDWVEALGFEIEEDPELEEFAPPEEEQDEEGVLQALIEGEIWLAYMRNDELLAEVAEEGDLPPQIKVYLPKEGSIVSGGHAGIPFNSPNKAAGLVFIDFLLSDDIQFELVEEQGKYPSIATIEDNDLPAEITTSKAWIPREDARDEWVPWPHFQYRIDLLDLWRSLTGD